MKKTSDNIVEMITPESSYLLGRKVKIGFEGLGRTISGFKYLLFLCIVYLII